MNAICTNIYPGVYPDLNVAEMDFVEGAAGPGRRLVVWLQGCLKRCSGCANGRFLPMLVNRVVRVDEIVRVVDDAKTLGGITLSGGEPLLQAGGLISLCEIIRDRGLTIVCFTGYTMDELTASGVDPAAKRFLGLIDLLIDGEYRHELPRAGWCRPTSNQQLHFLSGRISPQSCENNPDMVFTIAPGHAVSTGALPADIGRKIFERLRNQGITITPAV